MICFVADGWLIFLGFETEFQSISVRLIGDIEAMRSNIPTSNIRTLLATAPVTDTVDQSKTFYDTLC